MSELLRRRREGARLTFTLCRPEIHNALNDALIDELRDAFEEAGSEQGLRCIVVEGEGRSFCAGADLLWMKALVGASREENRADARRLVRLLDAMVGSRLPVIGRVHGAALGGGMGLVAACDLVVAHPKARFGLTEVRLGLAPAMIFPYLLRKVQRQHLLAAALTGERFDAEQAWRLGVVNEVCEDLDGVIERWERAFADSGPEAVAAVKELFARAPQLPPEEQRTYTTELIAKLRTSDEGQEGMRAFLEKREPHWRSASEEEV